MRGIKQRAPLPARLAPQRPDSGACLACGIDDPLWRVICRKCRDGSTREMLALLDHSEWEAFAQQLKKEEAANKRTP